MRKTNHIILDFYKSNKSEVSNYWVFNFIENNKSVIVFNKQKNLKLDSTKKYEIEFINQYKTFYKTFSTVLSSTKNEDYFKINLLNNVVNVNFLRKEILYTKLKYSRSPAFDSVSGGAAALLAGLIGFLTSEKFGMELVDSGDFYYLFMYLVFLSFSMYPLLFSSQANKSLMEILGPGIIISFYNTVLVESFRNIKIFYGYLFSKASTFFRYLRS